MITIKDKKLCSGCQACEQKCPKHCISMIRDEEGFLYPQVDSDKCVMCGLCDKTCPIQNPYEEKKPLNIFACSNNNEQVRMSSSSGGIFSLLSEKILSEQGVVFGAKYDENWQVIIDYIEKVEDLHLLQGSKYVQSRTGNSFSACESFLKENRKVLFSGTPCQIAGLKHYLKKDYENLWTCEVVCHGSPSPKVWGEYIKETFGTSNSINKISFRDKSNGWDRFRFSVTYETNGKKKIVSSDHSQNPYMKAFLSDMILRPSCYECSAKNGRSASDISLGDFWGITDIVPEFSDDKGTSMMVINSNHGFNLIDWDKITYKEVEIAKAIPLCKGMKSGIKVNPKRQVFFSAFSSNQGETTVLLKKYTKLPFLKQIRRTLGNIKRKIFCG
ncbi:MAG: Coenzyme F420 hydrogenase/dehydrogenase, beta subunit C-terminal domain [Fibrobacter sp.]|nr:Coenzyme F420 hydrogenase/dehydrogenase, beta subunit C-terminal domain [Fibrobacter sp.]